MKIMSGNQKKEWDMSKKYSLGIDFGTESGRALLVDVNTGEEIATSVYKYQDGVLDEYLPNGTKLGHDWALQNPEDYIRVFKNTIPEVLKIANVKAEDVIGVGIDFTACTMLPIDENDTPLCMLDDFKKEPNAWVKLWKHHAAQPQANKINEIGRKLNEDWVPRYGGRYSSEWFFSKALQTLEEAPNVYESADRFLEAADWVVLQLTGEEKRNACTAGYKAMWDKRLGYPSKEFFKALNPRMENIVDEKLSRKIYPAGTKAGEITAKMAKLTGLKQGTAVAVGNVDAHVAVPAATVVDARKMVMIMGTSICHMFMENEKVYVDGMCGVVEDGILAGFYGYEAGQSAVGDIFAWFVNTCVPPEYFDEAKRKGIDIHNLLAEKGQVLKAGESGLLAIDWWNGNRSVLVDADLTGLLMGANLNTKPEEIYRTLIEATAFGTNKIIKSFEDKGLKIDELYGCGGLPKNKFLMQIYSDVTGKEILVAESGQASALGSAMFGAVAAGSAVGGYDNITDSAKKMARVKDETFKPIKANNEVYKKLYAEYEILHDYFGRGANDVMKRLKQIKAEA
jgi:L-ribulokinase